jgi:hypothetical protein
MVNLRFVFVRVISAGTAPNLKSVLATRAVLKGEFFFFFFGQSHRC